MGSRAGLDAVAKRKCPTVVPCRELNPGRQAHRLVTVLNDLPRILLKNENLNR